MKRFSQPKITLATKVKYSVANWLPQNGNGNQKQISSSQLANNLFPNGETCYCYFHPSSHQRKPLSTGIFHPPTLPRRIKMTKEALFEEWTPQGPILHSLSFLPSILWRSHKICIYRILPNKHADLNKHSPDF